MFEVKNNKAKCDDCGHEIKLKELKPHEIKYCLCKGVKMRVVKYSDHFEVTKSWYQESIYF